MRRRVAALVVAGVLPAMLASQAHASIARVESKCVSNRYENYCTYGVHVDAGAREQNAFAIRITPEEVFVRDRTAPLEAGASCDAEDDGVICPRLRGSVQVALGDGDDSLLLEESSCVQTSYDRSYSCDYVRADGGPGADVLSGGTGNDALNGGAGPDELRGGTGDDHLYDGDPESSLSSDLLDGGDGFDYLQYGDRTRPLAIDLRAGTGGAAGEHDRLAGVDGVLGGSGPDVMFGDDAEENELDGANGDDVLRGRGGRDVLIGNDGSDRLAGGAGDDFVRPSTLVTRIGDYGQGADDSSDTVRCGAGDDFVRDATELDLMFAGCERVHAYGARNWSTLAFLTGIAAAPEDPVSRYVGTNCQQRRCNARLRLHLARRVRSTPVGTVVGERAVTLNRGENPPIPLRLNRLGRRLLRQEGRLRLQLRVGRYGRGDERERATAFSFETRLVPDG